MPIKERLTSLKASLPPGVRLVAVSKTHPPGAIREAYDAGQRLFGESRVQELVAKHEALPRDIEWHLIGHLQTNKVKYIAPFVSLIHSVDSARLLEVIDVQALRSNRVIDVLFEVHIAREEAKTGWCEAELRDYLASGAWRTLRGVRVRGVMGIATNTADEAQLRAEFGHLHEIFTTFGQQYGLGDSFDILSMGMSDDYPLAVACGSNLVRVGSLIFGKR